jgi:hypothetical protein
MADHQPEWAVWEAKAGYAELPDGRRVLVQGGDEVLMEIVNGGFVVLEHKPATRN